MNAKMDISKTQWRSTGGMPGFLLGSVDYNSNKCVFTTIYRYKVFIIIFLSLNFEFVIL